MSKTPRTIRRPRVHKTITVQPADFSDAIDDDLLDPPITRLGAALVSSAIARASWDPDRAVALVNAYTTLLTLDSRARA